MSRIIFNLAAKCDKAGRSQNQDNYWVCPDLTKWSASIDNVVGTDEDVELSDKGALLVVADGMGGMNAGEVASKLVIEGIQKKFSNIPDSILTNEDDVMSFIHAAIVESDESIKQYARQHKDAEGLGSTVVLLWLLNGRAFCGWCGDSRIYRFNPNNELVRLSHDHSYVQSLVDEGKIREEEAFDHPDSNIISKALGDNGNKADPEIRVYDIYSRDVFMLCSDGLCGILQDSELSEIISKNCTSSKETLKFLWAEGEKTGWSDNTTIDVLCVVDGGKPAKGRPDGYPVIAKKPTGRKEANNPQIVSGGEKASVKFFKTPYLYILTAMAVALLCIALYYAFGRKGADESTNHEYSIEASDSPAKDVDNSGATKTGGNQSSSPQSIRHGADNGNTNGGGQSVTPSRPTGTQGALGGGSQRQGSQSSGISGNVGGQQNGGTRQSVIDQLNPNNGTNGDRSTRPTEVYPSRAYIKLFETVKNDYNNASSAYSRVREKRWRSNDDDQTIFHYTRNIDNNLRSLRNDSDNFNALTDSQKAMVKSFERLASDIKGNYSKYPTAPPRPRSYDNDSYDDVYM